MSLLLANLDIGRALIALVIAIALYSVVQNEQNPAETGSFTIPVDLVHPPPHLVLMSGDAVTTVVVRVQAPRENWVSLRGSSLRAKADLSNALVGAHEYSVTVDVPDPRIRVVEISPPRITVRFEENLERTVPVRLARSGNPPFGYEAGEPELDPTSIAVSGPASLVRRVEAAVVDLKLDGLTVEINGRFSPTVVDAQGQAVTVEGRTLRLAPSTVRVRMPISQQISYKTVGVQPVISGVPASGFVIDGVSAEPSTVTIVGLPRMLAGVNAVETERVDVTDVTTGFSRQVGLVLPEGVTLAAGDSVRVSVRVTALSIAQSYATVPVVEGLGLGLQVVSALPTVQVTLTGPTVALRALRPADLRVSVNLSGLSVGTHRVVVEVMEPSGLQIQTVVPSAITVTLGDAAGNIPPPPTEVPRPTPVTPTATVEVPAPTRTASPVPVPPTATRTATPTVGTPVPTRS